MDYEKAYKEALERARELVAKWTGKNKDFYIGDYSYIFPELREKPLTPFQQCLNCILRGVYYAEVPDKEVNEFILNVVRTRTDELIKLAKRHEYTDCQLTEDEKIRKYLIDELKAAKSVGELKFIIPQPTREECIAYLEKQKEQKPAWGEVELLFRGEKVTVKRPFYRDDKGRGYSTTEQDEEVAWNALRAWCEKKGISLYDLYPKAEWSEEDDQLIGFIFDLLNDLIWRKDWAMSKEECLERLKSLRPQPHTVSIKDSTKFGNLEYERGVKDGIQHAENHHWKPSKEQMEELMGGLRILPAGETYHILLSLYNDLKKL